MTINTSHVLEFFATESENAGDDAQRVLDDDELEQVGGGHTVGGPGQAWF